MRFYYLAFSLLFALGACTKSQEKTINPSTKNARAGSVHVALSKEQLLGSKIFSDSSLSSPGGQACISCHSTGAAFSDANHSLPVSQGASPLNFGSRNAPTALYAMFIPPLHLEKDEEGNEDYVGGLFLDGRANSLEEQAKGPLINPLEMGATKQEIVSKVCGSEEYGALFRELYGAAICASDSVDQASTESAYNFVAQAIASFERSQSFAPFSAKFDKVMLGLDTFTGQEAAGFEVFKNKEKGNCAACHSIEPDPNANKALFTDYSYDNLGIPKNPGLFVLGHKESDLGLIATTKRAGDQGRFRVPTLRNIARTAPYGHNGYFRTLEQIVDFYNSRDTKPVCDEALSADEAESKGCWPSAEIPETRNKDELGNLKLTEEDKKALISFLQTLSDGYWE